LTNPFKNYPLTLNSLALFAALIMFTSGTQRQHWMFPGTGEIELLRQEANQRYIDEFGKNMDVMVLGFMFICSYGFSFVLSYFKCCQTWELLYSKSVR